MTLTLIIGGARSGKSDLALRLAAASGRDVLFVATLEPGDDEMRHRIAAHRSERPQHWRTIEAPHTVLSALSEQARSGDCVLLDCVTLWVSNLVLDLMPGADASAVPHDAIDRVVAAAQELVSWCAGHDGDTIAVTNEVGMGVVPAFASGRAFRDALGAVNRVLAHAADRVLLCSAGLVLDLKAAGAVPLDAFGPRPSGQGPA